MEKSECLICTENYDLESRRPKKLTCGHIFCSECLHQIILHNGIITCPLDSRDYYDEICTFPEPAEIIDYLARNLPIEMLICFVCNENYDLESRRPKKINCGHIFCSECLYQMTLKTGYIECPIDSIKYCSDFHTILEYGEIIKYLKEMCLPAILM